MIGLLGYNFCADKNAVDPMPTNAAKLSVVQIEGGIFDHINITSKTDGEYSEIPPTTWDFSTILDCDFADNISGGNISDISKDTTLVRIKRRVKGTYQWATIKEVPITKDEDLSFAFTDNLNLNNTTYEYAYVPVAGNQEGGYTIKEIYSKFKGVFVCDIDTIYKFYYGISYGDTEKVQQVGTYEPYGRKYPVVVSNGLIGYQRGSVSGMVLPDSYDDNRQIDRDKIVEKREELFKMLTNRKPKIIKDMNSTEWLVMRTGNPSVSYSRGYGMGVMSATAEWTQVGDANNIDDLYAAGAIVGKS